jgi:hypothetical protein
MTAREAYSLYVERAVAGANEADGPFSSLSRDKLAARGRISSVRGTRELAPAAACPQRGFRRHLSRPTSHAIAWHSRCSLRDA